MCFPKPLGFRGIRYTEGSPSALTAQDFTTDLLRLEGLCGQRLEDKVVPS